MISRVLLHYGSNTVRVVMHGAEPWFVHDDICRVLGIADAIQAAGRLDDYERTAAVLHTLSGREAVVIVSLCGLYSLIALAPKRAEVRAFKRWFTTGALPSIQAARGEAVPPPSGAEAGLHSTTEIARSLGVAPGALGRRAKHLKTARHGASRPAIGANSEKPVEQWWWTAAGRDAVLREFGARGAAVSP